MAAVLYTPEVLALATDLAAWPWDDALPLRATARSKSCGSALSMGLLLDDAGRIAALGLKPQACAIGQAAAAIFAYAAVGRDAATIDASLAAIVRWLGEREPEASGGLPDWPGIAALAAARDYPARHGAIMLAWRAASEALAS